VTNQGCTVRTFYGAAPNGAIQSSTKYCESKNRGRANATTATQQAAIEAKALWDFKATRNYSTTSENAMMPTLHPMLAKAYDPNKHEFIDGWYVQPKLDGVRCLAMWVGDKVVLKSRQGREYVLPHVSEALEQIMPNDFVLDGELYLHGEPLQTIISLIKRPQPKSKEITYQIYDAPVAYGNEDASFDARFMCDFLNDVWPNVAQALNYKAFSQVLHLVPTGIIMPGTAFLYDDAFDSPKEAEEKFVSQGYEGAMLRNPQGRYEFGYRSNDLLKVKSFQDAEFEVVGVRDGRGKMEGKSILICRNDLTETTFEVVPKCSMAEREKLFKNKASLIGRRYTVKFFDRTEDQLPRFPVGIAFREDV